MLTNNNDSVILTWRGLVLAGTNAWKLVYGSQTILDTGSFTNRDGGWEAGMEITRTGNTNQHVDAWIRYQQFFVSPSTNFLSGWQTNWDTWQTNGIAISNMLQVASNRAGSVSNNYLKVVYEPGLR
jgi:hypothetical protein